MKALCCLITEDEVSAIAIENSVASALLYSVESQNFRGRETVNALASVDLHTSCDKHRGRMNHELTLFSLLHDSQTGSRDIWSRPQVGEKNHRITALDHRTRLSSTGPGSNRNGLGAIAVSFDESCTTPRDVAIESQVDFR